MPLFSRLLALSTGPVRTEDALTEIVAHLFRLDWRARWNAGQAQDAAVVRWLRATGALSDDTTPTAVRVQTQVAYPALSEVPGIPDHATASRPDVVVHLTDADGRTTVVIVEAKVGSTAAPRQLPKYAEQLAVRHAPAHARALLYLTQRPDPREPDAVLANADRVRFAQARWTGVWNVLRAARPTAPPALGALYDETLAFLSDLGMDHPPRFQPADALALARVPDTLAFLDATLKGGSPSPAERLAQRVGPLRLRPSTKQIRENRRYAIYKTYGPAHAHFEVFLGYWLPQDGFPALFLGLCCLAPANGGGDVAEALLSLDGRSPIAADALRPWSVSADEWTWASTSTHLTPLLAGDDHADAVRGSLLDLVDELEAVQALPSLAALPWTAPGSEDSDE